MSAIPNKDEMRLLVKSIFNTASKMNHTIQINTLDDAASLAAYLYGFSSWAEYLVVSKKEYDAKKNEEFTFKVPKFKDKIIKAQDLDWTSPPTKQKLNNLPQVSSLMPVEMLIGKKKHHHSKTSQPVGLLTENYMATGAISSEIGLFFKNQVQWLLAHNQAIYLFGNFSESEEFIQSIKNETRQEITVIEKGAYVLDPIREALENDNFEALLDIVSFEEGQTFSWLWITLIKLLKTEIEWDAKTLLKSLDLEVLLRLKEYITQSNDVIYKMLNQYFFKKCQIKQEGEGYLISEAAQNLHYHNTFIIRERLEKIIQLYEKGYFSKKSTIDLKQKIFEKKSVVFAGCEDDKLQSDYWEFCALTFASAIRQQNKATQNLNPKAYQVWSLWWDIGQLLNENTANELLNNADTLILGGYALNNTSVTESWFQEFKQVIFFRQFIDDVSPQWKQKALSRTEKWEDNLWFGQYAVLKKLPKKTAYLWAPNGNLIAKDIESYDFKHFNLYDNFPGS